MDGRPDPDELLRQVEDEERAARRGRLKVFLGYASGVGKSHRMLDEGRRRRARGQDVVVGAVQTNVPPDVTALLSQLEVIPVRTIADRPVMDLEAILQRAPQLCLVDGLAHDNPPGCRHPHRWQDVEALLEAGVSVLGTVNLQYIAERSEAVARVRGKRVQETVPLAFVKGAAEIEMVDAPPEVCELGSPTLTPPQLATLREMALVLVADVVDHQLDAYLDREGLTPFHGAQERILVCITPGADASDMLQSGRRNTDRFHGELHVAWVRQPDLTAQDQQRLEQNLARARELGACLVTLEGNDPVDTILAYAREQGITQVFVGHTRQQGWRTRLRGTPVDRLLARAQGIDVQVFPH